MKAIEIDSKKKNIAKALLHYYKNAKDPLNYTSKLEREVLIEALEQYVFIVGENYEVQTLKSAVIVPTENIDTMHNLAQYMEFLKDKIVHNFAEEMKPCVEFTQEDDYMLNAKRIIGTVKVLKPEEKDEQVDFSD